jgi:hypothetical protein
MSVSEYDSIAIQNVVYYNLTVSIGGKSSFDGAGICVAVDAPGGPAEATRTNQ